MWDKLRLDIEQIDIYNMWRASMQRYNPNNFVLILYRLRVGLIISAAGRHYPRLFKVFLEKYCGIYHGYGKIFSKKVIPIERKRLTGKPFSIG